MEPGRDNRRGGASVFSGAAGGGTGRVQRCSRGRTGHKTGSEKRCARRPGSKKAPWKRCAAARTHTDTKKRTSVRSLLLCCYTTLLPYGLLLRDARPIPMHPAARQRPCTPEARLFCGRLPAACPLARARLPSISACPPVGSQQLSRSGRLCYSRSPPGVTTVKASAIGASAAQPSGAARRSEPQLPSGSQQLSRSGRPRCSPPSGPPLLFASAARAAPAPAAGVTAPPRRYGRPPAAGESPASSSRRASPARDSTAYRPAP